MQREAQKSIDNFQWQDLQNPYDEIGVSTLGADLQREESGRATASTLQALQSAGTRALGVGAGRLMQNSNNMNRQIAADLDMQRKNIDFAKAGQAVNNQNIIEGRQANEIQGYGQMLNVGMQMKYGGAADMMNAGQAQGQTNQSIMSSVMGGGMGGGMMGGGGGGGSQAPAPSVGYGNGMSTSGGYNDQNAMYAQGYGGSYA